MFNVFLLILTYTFNVFLHYMYYYYCDNNERMSYSSLFLYFYHFVSLFYFILLIRIECVNTDNIDRLKKYFLKFFLKNEDQNI